MEQWRVEWVDTAVTPPMPRSEVIEAYDAYEALLQWQQARVVMFGTRAVILPTDALIGVFPTISRNKTAAQSED